MKKIHQLLQQYYGFKEFRPLQEKIITSILEGKNCLVLMPTGGGKSICYQIPALILDGVTLVISPLISLMKDQVEALKANGINAIHFNSSLSSSEEREYLEDLLSGKVKLLYISPEKALGLMNGLLKSISISLIAVDEAHCISQWGHDFRPEYTQLNQLRLQFKDTPFVALTATADKTTRKDILDQLDISEANVFISSFDRPNLSLTVRSNVNEANKINEIIQFIKDRKDESGIIYCISRKNCEELSQKLNDTRIPSKYYHAGMSASDRSKVQEEFIKDSTQIICATIAFGMGIDKSNVRWIIHYNLPKSIESYYQEIGRAGRDGLPSTTILYYNLKDLVMLSKFASESGQKEINLEKLNRIQQYAESKICRRRILLNYFSEISDRDCKNCDACHKPSKTIDATIISQKAISCILRTDEKVGITMLINILRGSKNQEILDVNYHHLKSYGIGREYSYDEWRHYILQMLQAGLIEMAYAESFSLKVSSLGKEVVFNSKKVNLPIYEITEKYKKNEFSRPKLKIKEEDNLVVNPELYITLKKIRLEIAQSKGLPPYVIFHDSSLIQMCEALPTTQNGFLQISGVSHAKLNQYGDLFIKAIRSYLNISHAIENPIDDALSDYRIKEYINTLKSFQLTVNTTMLSLVLLRSRSQAMTYEIQQLDFYGLLKDVVSKEELLSTLDIFNINNPGWFDANPADELKKFLNSEKFNNTNPELIDKITNWSKKQCILRENDTIDNEYILTTRKDFRRAYEPWNEEEQEFLRQLIHKTNDINVIAKAIERNDANVKSFLKSYFTLKR